MSQYFDVNDDTETERLLYSAPPKIEFHEFSANANVVFSLSFGFNWNSDRCICIIILRRFEFAVNTSCRISYLIWVRSLHFPSNMKLFLSAASFVMTHYNCCHAKLSLHLYFDNKIDHSFKCKWREQNFLEIWTIAIQTRVNKWQNEIIKLFFFCVKIEQKIGQTSCTSRINKNN